MGRLSKLSRNVKYRLPEEIVPIRYDLHFEIGQHFQQFHGTAAIHFEITKPIAYIPLHAKDLKLHTERVQLLDQRGLPTRNMEPFHSFSDKLFDYWVTEFTHPLAVGEYLLRIKFQGTCNANQLGLYVVHLIEQHDNHHAPWPHQKQAKKQSVVLSRFQPIFAHYAYPCFDQPDKKAVYAVTIVLPHHSDYHALSNMHVAQIDKRDPFRQTIRFAESLPMSCYTSCFVVTNFTATSRTVRCMNKNNDEFEMAIYTRAAQQLNAAQMLDECEAIVAYFASYFKMRYPLPKLDILALPEFLPTAADNWGLIVGRECNLIMDPAYTTTANKQRIATLLANEMCLMWFGNWVTLKWWNDLWFFEGFASYMEYKCIDQLHPNWGVPAQFLILDLYPAMKADAKVETRPLERQVNSTGEIIRALDKLSYSKGAALLRMLESLIGEQLFHVTVDAFLTKYSLENATSQDFFDVLNSQNINLRRHMSLKTYQVQSGYPVVKVVQIVTNKYELTQHRFLAKNIDYKRMSRDSKFDYSWDIPISYVSNANTRIKFSVFQHDAPDHIIDLSTEEPVKWIKFNKDHCGYYRVNYSAELWQQLIDALQEDHKQFSVADRAQLISDAFTLAEAAQLPYKIPFDLMSYMEMEYDFVPWYIAVEHLKTIKLLLRSTDTYDMYMEYVRGLVRDTYNSVGWKKTTNHVENLLRITILDAACAFELPNALKIVSQRFAEFLKNPKNRPEPDIRDIVYFYGMQQSGTANWERIYQLYLDEEQPQEKLKLLRALSAIRHSKNLEQFISLASTDEQVSNQHFLFCLRQIACNPKGQNLVWIHIASNWPQLRARFSLNELGILIRDISQKFTSNTKHTEIRELFAKYPDDSIDSTLRIEAMNNVAYNQYWINFSQPEILSWLMEQGETFVSCSDFQESRSVTI